MDILQIALVFLILLLSVLLSVLGIQVFFILRDLKKGVDKIDLLLGDARNLAEEVKRPIRAAADLSSMVETGVQVFKGLSKNKEAKRLFKKKS